MSPNLNPERERVSGVETAPVETLQPPVQEQPEVGHEGGKEKKEAESASHKEAVGEGAYAQATAPHTQDEDTRTVPLQQEEIKRIEQVLEEHLGELYARLPDDKKEAFKVKGEETAQSIQLVLHKTKVKLKEIISLIVSWLSMIPGVNKFFIEQQAEIKANKLLRQHEQMK